MLNKSIPILCLFVLFFPLLVFGQNKEQKNASQLNEIGQEFINKRNKVYDHAAILDLSYQALPYFQESKNWPAIVDIKMMAAQSHYHLHQYKKFENNITDLKQILNDHQVSDSLTNESRKILAWHAETKEDYTTAEQLYKLTYAWDTKHSNNTTTSYGASNLGYFYDNYLNDSQRALEYCQKAIKLNNESKNKDELSQAVYYSNMGSNLIKLDQTQSALAAFHQSLKIIAPQKEQYWKTLSIWWNSQNISAIHLDNGALDSFLYYHKKALTILEKDQESYQDDYQTYHTFGKYLTKSGDYSQAIEYYKKGVTRAKKQVDVFRPIKAIVALAKVLSENEQHTEALDSIQTGLQLLCPDFNSNSIYSTPPAKSFVHRKSALQLIETRANIFYRQFEKNNNISQLKAALQNYQLADDIILLIRQNYTNEISKYFLAAEVLPIYEKSILVAQKLYTLEKEKKYLEAAFRFAEQNKSVLLLESIKANTAKGFGQIPDSILKQEKEYKLNITSIDKRIYSEKKQTTFDKNRIKNFEDERFTLKEKYNDLIATIEQQYPKYFEYKYQPTIVSIENLQQRYLDQESTLVEYFVGEENIFIFTIKKDNAQIFKVNKSEEITTRFNQLRHIINKAPVSTTYNTELQIFNQQTFYFYQLLLQEGLVNNTSNHLIIIPDDFLNYLPFEVLNTKQNQAASYSITDQNYLLETYDISYSFSASLLLNTKDQAYNTENSYAGFAPNFNNPIVKSSRGCGNGDLYSLQCSKQEVLAINKLFNGKTFSDDQASKSNFESVLKNFNIIHLATHACVDDTDPNFSRIHFTDDYLSNYDLTNMRIEANLAVLSACNTNVGPLMKGDGISSISKGFILAGCPSILTSLWSVDDCTTSDLMLNFYQSLKKGNTKSKSLREAKLIYLETADRVGSHPHYWAPFLLSGQNTAIVNNHNSFAIWISIIILAGFISSFLWLKRIKTKS